MQSPPAPDASLLGGSMSCRVVPDRLVKRDGADHYRVSLVLLPDSDLGVDDWPSHVRALLQGGVRLGFLQPNDLAHAASRAQWVDAKAHVLNNEEDSKLWRALVDPVPTPARDPAIDAVVPLAKKLEASIAASRGLANNRWTDRMKRRRNEDTLRAYRMTASIAGPVRLASADLQAAHEVFTRISAYNHATSLRALYERRQPGTLSASVRGVAPPKAERLLDSVGLLRGRVGTDLAGALGADPDAQVRDTTKLAIGTFGLQEARQRDVVRASSSNPFDRQVDAERVEGRVSDRLSDAIDNVFKARKANAPRVYNAAYSGNSLAAAAASLDRAKAVTDWLERTWTTPLVGRVVDDADKVAKAAMDELLADHMIATRPDLPLSQHKGYVTADPVGQHVRLQALRNVEEKRVFGMLAYPAVARVVKLVVDVEVPAAKVPSFARAGAGGASPHFLVAAAIGGTREASLWTASMVDHGMIVALSRDEVTGKTGTATEHWRGSLNLGQLVDAKARYTLTSFDVLAASERYTHKARGVDAADRSAETRLPDAELPDTTIGVELIDGQREAAVQAEIARSDAQKAALKSGKPAVVYCEDLSAGLRIDVGVTPRGPSLAKTEWRSLMQRRLVFGDVIGATGVRIDVEKLVTRALEAAVPPGMQVSDYRLALDEASVRPATRMASADITSTPGAEPKVGQLIAQQALFRWDGDPAGFECGTEALDPELTSDGPPGLLDDRTDLMLPVTVGPPGRGAKRPPRLEIARSFQFRARHALLGGGGIRTGDFEAVGNAIAPTSAPKITYRRQERVAAPKIALLASDPALGRGEKLEKLVIRAPSSKGSKDVTRRIVYVPGVPMASAAQHPRGDDSGRRALDDLPVAKKRPVGGMFNVVIDAGSGGLPVRRNDGSIGIPTEAANSAPAEGEGVFVIRETDFLAIAGRKAHHFPDPAAESIALELLTRDREDLDETPFLSVGVYDRAYLQDGPDGLGGSSYQRCEFPHAMPVLVEVRAAKMDEGPPARFVGDPEIGSLSESGRFRRLRPGERPPAGSVTVKRVLVEAIAGADFVLRSWCGVPAGRRDWFDGFARGADLFAKSFLGSASTGEKLRLDDFFNQLLHRYPLPELAEVREAEIVQAVVRPDTPSWPSGGPTMHRLGYSQDEWVRLQAPLAIADQNEWTTRNLGVAGCWIGGEVEVDAPDTGSLSLSISHVEANDVPGSPIRTDGADRPVFDQSAPTVIAVPLARPVLDVRRKKIDLMMGGGTRRGLFLALPDARAYKLTVRPTASAAFKSCFSDQTPPGEFEQAGPEVVVWALAARRPDSMGKVEILPVLVWETESGDRVRTISARLAWRRSRRAPSDKAGSNDARQAWLSSGLGERLAFIFAPASQAGAGSDEQRFGRAADHITKWGADPIRQSRARPAWHTPISDFEKTPDAVVVRAQWLPYPGDTDDRDWSPDPVPPKPAVPASAFAANVDLLTIEPRFDQGMDAWYVDVTIDAKYANSWLRLGLARYQPNAKLDDERPRRDLRVSRPSTIEFEVKPRRSVRVRGLPYDRATKRWPVSIEVRGPLGVVNGSPRDAKGNVNGPALERSRPLFRAVIRRHDADHDPETAPVDIIDKVDSTGAPSPDGDVLWSTTVHLRRSPFKSRHTVLVSEADEMFSAYSDDIVETGPSFVAVVPVRRARKASG